MVKRPLIIGASSGYVVGLLAANVLPAFVVLAFPAIGAIIGALLAPGRKRRQEITEAPDPNLTVLDQTPAADDEPNDSPDIESDDPVLQYLEVLEDMVISEGQKNNLDNEIVTKACSLFLRIQRIIPLLNDFPDGGAASHTISRLVLQEINGIINPFLRLSGEGKIKNRRLLLDGIRDVNQKLNNIVTSIEHKDLLELQSKAEIIHQRYARRNNSLL